VLLTNTKKWFIILAVGIFLLRTRSLAAWPLLYGRRRCPCAAGNAPRESLGVFVLVYLVFSFLFMYTCVLLRSVSLFSSPEHKVLRVSYCDRPLSVVRRRPSSVVRKLFYLNIFSSETTHWILTKLHWNDPWVVPYQSF